MRGLKARDKIREGEGWIDSKDYLLGNCEINQKSVGNVNKK